MSITHTIFRFKAEIRTIDITNVPAVSKLETQVNAFFNKIKNQRLTPEQSKEVAKLRGGMANISTMTSARVAYNRAMERERASLLHNLLNGAPNAPANSRFSIRPSSIQPS